MALDSSATFLMTYPNARFKNLKDGVISVKSVTGAFIVAFNQQVVVGIAGKRLRAIGYRVQSENSAHSFYTFKNGTGGASLDGGLGPSANGLPLIMPPYDPGYFETTTGTGLFVDIQAHPTNLTVYYIEYTP